MTATRAPLATTTVDAVVAFFDRLGDRGTDRPVVADVGAHRDPPGAGGRVAVEHRDGRPLALEQVGGRQADPGCAARHERPQAIERRAHPTSSCSRQALPLGKRYASSDARRISELYPGAVGRT